MKLAYYDRNQNLVFYSGSFHLINPNTGEPWLNESEALSFVNEYNASITPIPEIQEPVVIPVTDIEITGTSVELQGNIYWAKAGDLVTITANVMLPNGRHIIMLDEMVDATIRVSGIREIGTINNGVFTLPVIFPRNGNFVLEADRLSRGFQRIGQNIQFEFPLIEFDIYNGIV